MSRGFTDEELSVIKVELGTEAYRDPVGFQRDRHYVARAIVRRAIDEERERVLACILLWRKHLLTDEQLVRELGYEQASEHLKELVNGHSRFSTM